MRQCVRSQGLGEGTKDTTEHCHLCALENAGKHLEITWSLKERQAPWRLREGKRGRVAKGEGGEATGCAPLLGSLLPPLLVVCL